MEGKLSRNRLLLLLLLIVLLERFGAEVAQRRVAAPCGCTRSRSTPKTAVRAASREAKVVGRPVRAERCKETFRRRIVPAVSLAAHAARHAICFEPCLIVAALVLAAPSLWHSSPAHGRRSAIAMSRAERTRLRSKVWPIAQPTMRRENRSRITARYSQPAVSRYM